MDARKYTAPFTLTVLTCLNTGMGSALAQNQQADQELVEEIAVTGSRISRSGMNTPVPVTSVGTEEMEALSPGQLIQSLDQMPQFFNNTRPDGAAAGRYSGGGAGQSFLNMRGMGPNRTLVLLDGRRVVPTSKLGSVDINLFPEAMIRRMEVVTGGASAAYGSDAVSGVTNFILDTDFVGVETHVQAGITDRSDWENEEVAFAFGADIGARGHIQGSLEYYHSDSLFGYDERGWFRDWAHMMNPDPNGPTEITMPNVGTTQYTYGGLITGGPLAGTQFLPDGTPAPFDQGILSDSGSQSGGDGVNPQRLSEIYPETTRKNAFVYGDYQLTNDLTVYAQGIYARGRVDYLAADLAQFFPFGEATIYADNPFLPASTQQRMTSEGIESFPMGRRSSLGDWQDVEGSRNKTRSITLGFEQDFDNGWRLEGYYQTGRNDRDLYSYTARMDRAYRAMDAVTHPETGEIVCRSTLSNPDDGCVPANFFGIGQMSQASIDYMLDWRVGTSVVEQDVAEVALDGPVFGGVGAGEVLGAVGVSWREETLDAWFVDPPDAPDVIPPAEEDGYLGLPPNYANQPDIFFANEMLDARGAYDVKEVFGEAVVPLLADHDYARSLNVSLSARYADYSGSGGVLAWKGGADWQVTDAVRLRATRSRDTRAANLGERYDWKRTSGGVDDPWAGTTGEPPRDGVIEGGNPEVDPELSDTLTWGIVYQPGWAESLSLSVDHYRVEIEDAIAAVGAQNIIDQCFTQGAFCDMLQRDPDTGIITRVDNTATNLEQATVEGVDLEATYNWLMGGGATLNIRFLASYLAENSFTNQFGDTIEQAGEGTLPEWTATAMAIYNRDAFSLALTSRYIGSAVLDLDDVEGVDIDDNSIASATYFHLRGSYAFDDIFGGRLSVFANVQNLFDRDPPRAPGPLSSWVGASHTNSLFDQLGRRYTLGVRFRY